MITFSNEHSENEETFLVLSVYDPCKVNLKLPGLYFYKVKDNEVHPKPSFIINRAE